MNITVYLGANEGNDPFFKEAVRELGAWIGTNGNTLVYGGSKSGLMGELAESVLQAGGKVIGVEPVSYKHLDVYKRQDVYRSYFCKRRSVKCWICSGKSAYNGDEIL